MKSKKTSIRPQLFEFVDFPSFPDFLRDAMLDFLSFLLRFFGTYDASIPLILNLIKKTEISRIIELGSGSGGDSLQIYREIKNRFPSVEIFMSDKNPNISASNFIKKRSFGEVNYLSSPVDAKNIPLSLSGIFTMYTSLHHFSPEDISLILEEISSKECGVAFFDASERNLFLILGMFFFPALVLLSTPFIKPFRFSRIFFTYIIPLIPIFAFFDGLLSSLRVYTVKEIASIVEGLKNQDYKWEYGSTKYKLGFKMVYLIGYPTDK